MAYVAVLNEVMRSLWPAAVVPFPGLRWRDGIVAGRAHRRGGSAPDQLDADQRRVVRAVGRRYGTSPAHARKVAQLAAILFDSLHPLHRLAPAYGRILQASAYLYNIGHFVNDARHHKHSFYLVMNSDLPGFIDSERSGIANLCRYHRKSMPQPTHGEFQALDLETRDAVVFLIPLLRIAVALDQSQEQKVESVEASIQDRLVELRLVSTKDTDIEQWHAGQVAEVFHQVYGRQMVLRAKR